MKITFITLCFAFFLGASQALPLDEASSVEEVKTFFEEVKPEVLPGFVIPEVDTAEVKPPRPPQLHDNIFQQEKPFSGQLVNVLRNQKGLQETIQKNRIRFNIERSVPPPRGFTEN